MSRRCPLQSPDVVAASSPSPRSRFGETLCVVVVTLFQILPMRVGVSGESVVGIIGKERSNEERSSASSRQGDKQLATMATLTRGGEKKERERNGYILLKYIYIFFLLPN